MKTKLMMMVVAIFALFTLNSCDSKESYVKDFTQFIEEVAADCEEYSAEDWEKADKTYEELVSTRYEKFSKELTTDDMIDIAKLKATYATLQVKRGTLNLKKKLDEAFK